ncbi:MAG TPA: hypothetical protein PLN64_05645, partial [Candidatus Bipolaricaulis anaerobius]|nr:hypothetical protein [Candidatus Bipolaricaulis anaerobius]
MEGIAGAFVGTGGEAGTDELQRYAPAFLGGSVSETAGGHKVRPYSLRRSIHRQAVSTMGSRVVNRGSQPKSLFARDGS